MQLASHLVDDGASPQEAISTGRAGFGGDARVDPYVVVVEADMPWATIEGYRRAGTRSRRSSLAGRMPVTRRCVLRDLAYR